MSKRDKYGNEKTKLQNALESLIKWVSLIGLIIAMGIMAMLYFGPEITLNTSIVLRLAVPSVVLAISVSIVYTMWISNGQRSAASNQKYMTLQETYMIKSERLHYPTLQEFLNYEVGRRYQVEYDRLTNLLDRETAIRDKMILFLATEKADRKKLSKFKRFFTSRNNLDRIRLRQTNRRIRKWTKSRDVIKIVLPYDKSEEFDYLRYSQHSTVHKEYSPKAAEQHLRQAKAKKYLSTFTFTLIGFNLLSIGATAQGGWAAIIMTSLALIALSLGVIQGFTTGYKNISIISTGIYNTAVSYLDQAVAYCDREGKNLYYKGVNQFKEIKVDPEDELPRLDGSEFVLELPKPELDIFAKAALEVTKTDKLGI